MTVADVGRTAHSKACMDILSLGSASNAKMASYSSIDSRNRFAPLAENIISRHRS